MGIQQQGQQIRNAETRVQLLSWRHGSGSSSSRTAPAVCAMQACVSDVLCWLGKADAPASDGMLLKHTVSS